MTPETEAEVIAVPETPPQTEEGRRSMQVAFLRAKFPGGVQPHQYADMLYALDIAQTLFPVVIRTVTGRPARANERPQRQAAPIPASVAPPPTAPRASPPKASPPRPPLSRGAKAVIKLIAETPQISVEKIANALAYKQGYVTQLVAEARRSGVIIDTIIDPKTKTPRYTLVTTTAMREVLEAPSPTTHH